MAQRIRIPGFGNDIMLNADEIMYAEVGGDKKAPYVAIYFNNADAVVQLEKRAVEHPNGLIALNITIAGLDAYEGCRKLLQGLNNALTGFGNGLTVVNHNYGLIQSVRWQTNNVSPSVLPFPGESIPPKEL
tara:strand:+ start:1175 stop:1567 length:393 start_codon:yes stop_codon:yes gene_type:complete